jgi:hypothetical protein
MRRYRPVIGKGNALKKDMYRYFEQVKHPSGKKNDYYLKVTDINHYAEKKGVTFLQDPKDKEHYNLMKGKQAVGSIGISDGKKITMWAVY